MIDAGSGYPLHWHGESGEANLATAKLSKGHYPGVADPCITVTWKI